MIAAHDNPDDTPLDGWPDDGFLDRLRETAATEPMPKKKADSLTACPNCEEQCEWSRMMVCHPGCGRFVCEACRPPKSPCPFCKKANLALCSYPAMYPEQFRDE
jgi:hypothetical protein